MLDSEAIPIPGAIYGLACSWDVSEQRASQQTGSFRLASLQTDHFDLTVCKLVNFAIILQLPVRELIDCFAYSLS